MINYFFYLTEKFLLKGLSYPLNFRSNFLVEDSAENDTSKFFTLFILKVKYYC